MTTSQDPDPQVQAIRWPAPVIRLTLRWDGQVWLVVRQHRVASMTLPASDVPPAGDETRGFWIEVLDREGRVRHREVMTDPLAGMEQFEAGGGITRLLHPPHDVEIEVLIPDLPDLAELQLVSNPATPAPGREAPSGPQRTRLRLDTYHQDPNPPQGPGGHGGPGDKGVHGGHDAHGGKR